MHSERNKYHRCQFKVIYLNSISITFMFFFFFFCGDFNFLFSIFGRWVFGLGDVSEETRQGIGYWGFWRGGLSCLMNLVLQFAALTLDYIWLPLCPWTLKRPSRVQRILFFFVFNFYFLRLLGSHLGWTHISTWTTLSNFNQSWLEFGKKFRHNYISEILRNSRWYKKLSPPPLPFYALSSFPSLAPLLI